MTPARILILTNGLLLVACVWNGKLDGKQMQTLWNHYHSQTPPPSVAFIVAGFLFSSCRLFLKMAKAGNWLRLARSMDRQPIGVWNAFRVLQRRSDWFKQLDFHTAELFNEMKATHP